MTRRRCLVLGALAGAGVTSGVAAAGPQEERSLREAVAAFNVAAQLDPVGKGQPPLTDEEVIAAIRGWIREKVKASDEVHAAYQKIAETGRLPKEAELDFTTGWIGFRGYDFDVWWIDLTLRNGEGTGYTYRIRDQKLRCRPSMRKNARDDS
jgi:hypothetical protein